MKRKLWLTALIPLLIVVLLFTGTGCPQARSTNDNDSDLTLQDVKDEVDAFGEALAITQGDVDDINGALEEIEGIDQADFDNLVESVNELTATVGTLVADMQTVKDDIAKLEEGNSDGGTDSDNGELDIKIVDTRGCDFEDTTLQDIYSTGTATPYYFTVEIANGTDDDKWIYCSLVLTRKGVLGGTTTDIVATPTLSNLDYSGSITYDASYTNPDATSVVFTPTGTYQRFSVGDGKTVEVEFRFTIATTAKDATWDGNLIYSVSDSGW